jgi:hypothetical protein
MHPSAQATVATSAVMTAPATTAVAQSAPAAATAPSMTPNPGYPSYGRAGSAHTMWGGLRSADVTSTPGQFVVAKRRSLTTRSKVAFVLAVLLACAAAAAYYFVFRPATGPQAIASKVAADLQSGNDVQICELAISTEVAKCHSELVQAAGHRVVYEGLGVGKVTERGNRAIVVLTGTVCDDSGSCLSNKDANAAFDGGHTFDQVWSAAIGQSASSVWTMPLVEQNGAWYVTGI